MTLWDSPLTILIGLSLPKTFQVRESALLSLRSLLPGYGPEVLSFAGPDIEGRCACSGNRNKTPATDAQQKQIHLFPDPLQSVSRHPVASGF